MRRWDAAAITTVTAVLSALDLSDDDLLWSRTEATVAQLCAVWQGPTPPARVLVVLDDLDALVHRPKALHALATSLDTLRQAVNDVRACGA